MSATAGLTARSGRNDWAADDVAEKSVPGTEFEPVEERAFLAITRREPLTSAG
jgi:hypothetical protein